MKPLKSLRTESSFKREPKDVNISSIFESDDDEDGIEDDNVGNALVALNHLAIMSDDLYSAIGDEGELDDTDSEVILNAYELISDIYSKYKDAYDLPSEDEIDDEIDEALAEQVIVEGLTWKNLVKTLTGMGFKSATPGPSTYGNTDDISHLFGIPMRAGKWADSFFVIYFDEDKPYGIVLNGKVTRFDNLGKAIDELKKITESVKETEAVETTSPKLSEKAIAALKTLQEPTQVQEKISDDLPREVKQLHEAFDETKFRKLSQTGLVDKSDVSRLVIAMKTLDAGKTITPAQKDLISNTFLTLIGILTGDTAILSKVSQAAKSSLGEDFEVDVESALAILSNLDLKTDK